MGVYYCIYLYLPFFDSMFGVKRAKKCISDLLASLNYLRRIINNKKYNTYKINKKNNALK